MPVTVRRLKAAEPRRAVGPSELETKVFLSADWFKMLMKLKNISGRDEQIPSKVKFTRVGLHLETPTIMLLPSRS